MSVEVSVLPKDCDVMQGFNYDETEKDKIFGFVNKLSIAGKTIKPGIKVTLPNGEVETVVGVMETVQWQRVKTGKFKFEFYVSAEAQQALKEVELNDLKQLGSEIDFKIYENDEVKDTIYPSFYNPDGKPLKLLLLADSLKVNTEKNTNPSNPVNYHISFVAQPTKEKQEVMIATSATSKSGKQVGMEAS